MAKFKEKFAMKTTLETDMVTQRFIAKPTTLEIHIIKDGKKEMIGSADFNLDKYSET